MLTPAVDDLLYLVGDEDCDVSVQCRECSEGGEPVVFYTHGKNQYDEQRVPTARTIAELVTLMLQHVRDEHGVEARRSIPVVLVGPLGPVGPLNPAGVP